jgi:hypothetical protein
VIRIVEINAAGMKTQGVIKTEKYVFNKYQPITKKRFSVTCDRFEIFTAMTMKNAVFGDIILCGSCKN